MPDRNEKDGAATGAQMDGAGSPAEVVADICLGRSDSTGQTIQAVYARNAPRYAIYRTRERVLVHFADDPALAERQRQQIVPLNPLRGEINGLIDGWHHPTAPGSWNLLWSATSKRAKAERFDRRVADALIMALRGDTTHPAELLEQAKNDVIAERKAMARGKYLIVAGLFAMFVWLIAWVASSGFAIPEGGEATSPAVANESLQAPDETSRQDQSLTAATTSIWLSTAGGSLGAFFSIAIALRGRTILTDLQTRENSTDAVLRVLIGAIGGGILICLFKTDVVRFLNVEPAHLVLDTNAAASVNAWLNVLIIGFIAGFSERLVPDLLAGAAKAPDTSGREPPPPAAAATAGTGVATVAGEQAANGADGQAGQSPASSAQAEVAEDLPREDDDEDVCLVDVELPDDEATSDAELPPAHGGVRMDDAPAQPTPEPHGRA